MLSVTQSKTMNKNPSKGSLNSKDHHAASEISTFTSIVRELQYVGDEEQDNLSRTIGHSFSRMAEQNDQALKQLFDPRNVDQSEGAGSENGMTSLMNQVVRNIESICDRLGNARTNKLSHS